MENLIGKWATIPINDIKKRELDSFIHSEDLDKIEFLTQPVNLIITDFGSFLELQLNEINSIRINPSILQISIKPDYFVNDKVKTINSKGNLEFGIVKDFYWHANNGKYIYLLEVDGKMKSRRYFAEDLESNEN